MYAGLSYIIGRSRYISVPARVKGRKGALYLGKERHLIPKYFFYFVKRVFTKRMHGQGYSHHYKHFYIGGSNPKSFYIVQYVYEKLILLELCFFG